MLVEPLEIADRLPRYRFYNQKARVVAAVFSDLDSIRRDLADRQLRDALLGLKGIGPKTASWIVRNLRSSDDVAILDVHILRAGRMLGIFPDHLRVERHYAILEDAFLEFSRAIGARASILDSVIWMTMRGLPEKLIHGMVYEDGRKHPDEINREAA